MNIYYVDYENVGRKGMLEIIKRSKSGDKIVACLVKRSDKIIEIMNECVQLIHKKKYGVSLEAYMEDKETPFSDYADDMLLLRAGYDAHKYCDMYFSMYIVTRDSTLVKRFQIAKSVFKNIENVEQIIPFA